MPNFRSKFKNICRLTAIGTLVGFWPLCSGCSGELPEAESRGAQLYKRSCAAKGCHDPIPPQRGGKRYWDRQFERMKPLMRKQGHTLPSAEEEREILAYLHRHAQSKTNKE